MEPWRDCWRRLIQPQMADDQLRFLQDALACRDAVLVRGYTCLPKPLTVTRDTPVTACCPVTYCGWSAGICKTVGNAELYLASVSKRAEPMAAGHLDWMRQQWPLSPFLHWWDESDDDVYTLLAEEVQAELLLRGAA